MKNISIKIFVLILSIVSLNSYGQISEDYLKKGDAKYATKDYKGAIEDYNKSIALNPKNGDIYFKRGIAKAYSVNNIAAMKDYKRAAKKGCKNADVAYYMVGMIEKGMWGTAYVGGQSGGQRNYSKAIKNFTKAINLNPNYADAYLERGICRVNLPNKNNLQEALDDFTKAIQLNTQRVAEAYYYSGNCKYGKKGMQLEAIDPMGACSDWQKAISLGYTNAQMKIDKCCK